MPIHDWSRVDAGLFHHFRQTWVSELARLLNAGRLPKGYYALLERRFDEDEAAFIAGLDRSADVPDAVVYAYRSSRIAVRNPADHAVAMIDVVSPGDKSSATLLRAFIERSAEFLREGIHVLIVDLFPPTPRDLQGIHKAIWDEIEESPFDAPPAKPLTVVAYYSGVPKTAYVEPVAAGAPLPALPIFLDDGTHIPAPLEESYETTWNACPQPLTDAVQVSAS